MPITSIGEHQLTKREILAFDIASIINDAIQGEEAVDVTTVADMILDRVEAAYE